MLWFSKKLVCVHCSKEKTRRVFEGKPTCEVCELQIQMDREDRIRCPHDGSVMTKKAVEGTKAFIDRCSICQGVWLDADELKKVCEEVSSGNGGSLAV